MNIKDREIEIRPIKNDEVESVFHVYQECEDFLELGPVPKASMEMVKTDIDVSKEENRYFCGIFINNDIAGIFDFGLDNYLCNLKHAYLALLMIVKPFRNNGLGTRVVKLVESEIIKNKTIDCIFSGVQINNLKAIRFWKNNGYEIYAGPELLEDKTTVYHLKKVIVKN